MFDDLVVKAREPERFVRYIETAPMSNIRRSFAAELAGQMLDPALTLDLLVSLVEHPSNVVRLGAIYGLRGQPATPELKKLVWTVATSETHPAVRRAAEDLMEWQDD